MTSGSLKMYSRAYVAHHEAGHVVVARAWGLIVEEVELVKSARGSWKGSTRVQITDETRDIVACAGLAAEYVLFHEGQVADGWGRPISRETFIKRALKNANLDKAVYFGMGPEAASKPWSTKRNNAFLAITEKDAVPLLRVLMPQVKKVAVSLELHGRLSEEMVETLVSY